MKKCDILIAGSGIAGLSLLYSAMKSGIWADRDIVVVDQEKKAENDKTISFWKQDVISFDHIIHAQWTQISFFSNAGEKIYLEAGPYSYCSIRSIDFYRECLSYLSHFSNITFVTDAIESITQIGNVCHTATANALYRSNLVFNSCFGGHQTVKGEQYFLQHFKGIRIKTDQLSIPQQEAYLMDFRTSQENGTSFFYTLPLPSSELFVEYTVFSKKLLKESEYDEKIKEYLAEVLEIGEYQVLETEFGVIPMTDHDFARRSGNIINIGTAGGDTRGSTGYTFTNLQKTIEHIIFSYQEYGHPFFKHENLGLKERLYDSTLLNVLDNGRYPGHQLFTDLFKGTEAHHIFRFLDAESKLWQDIKIMRSLRTWPLLYAFVKALPRMVLCR